MCIEGKSLETLITTNPGLPSRFFCFLASYQGERLYKLTESFADAKKPDVTIPMSMRLSVMEVLARRPDAHPHPPRTSMAIPMPMSMGGSSRSRTRCLLPTPRRSRHTSFS